MTSKERRDFCCFQQERIMRQRRNLRALAGICKFHPMLFLEVVIKRKSNSWDVRTFTIDCLKCHQVHTRSPQRKTMQNTVLGTAVWHEIFAGSNFCDFCRFSSDPQKYVPVNKNTTNIFSAKIYSRVNILYLEFATQRHITQKSCLFNHNLSKKTKYWFIVRKSVYFYCTYSINAKILSILGTGYFLKMAKINSQQDKLICPNRKN